MLTIGNPQLTSISY